MAGLESVRTGLARCRRLPPHSGAEESFGIAARIFRLHTPVKGTPLCRAPGHPQLLRAARLCIHDSLYGGLRGPSVQNPQGWTSSSGEQR